MNPARHRRRLGLFLPVIAAAVALAVAGLTATDGTVTGDLAAAAAGTTAHTARPAMARPAAAAPTTRPYLGTLGTRPETASAEARSGIGVGMVELNWGAYEPQEGVYDANYLRIVKARIAAMRAAGMRVTLGLGLHFAPSWVAARPDSHFVDQHGRVSREVDLVFNSTLRSAAQRYLDRVDADLALESFHAVRITSGSREEVLYPEGGSYWAFGRNAQNGPGMPASMTRNPLPGWKPGTPGKSVAQVSAWQRWYVGALADTVDWQVRELRRRGFTGFALVLTPGFGLTPNKVTNAVAADLPDGVMGVGAAWAQLYGGLRDRRNVVAYISSVADGSGGDVGCSPADRTTPTTAPAVAFWSSTRWISRVADQYGLLKAGEPPGYYPKAASAAHYRDTGEGGLAATAVRMATSCGLVALSWAHDDQFHGPTQVMPLSSWTRWARSGTTVPPVAPRLR